MLPKNWPPKNPFLNGCARVVNARTRKEICVRTRLLLPNNQATLWPNLHAQDKQDFNSSWNCKLGPSVAKSVPFCEQVSRFMNKCPVLWTLIIILILKFWANLSCSFVFFSSRNPLNKPRFWYYHEKKIKVLPGHQGIRSKKHLK